MSKFKVGDKVVANTRSHSASEPWFKDFLKRQEKKGYFTITQVLEKTSGYTIYKVDDGGVGYSLEVYDLELYQGEPKKYGGYNPLEDPHARKDEGLVDTFKSVIAHKKEDDLYKQARDRVLAALDEEVLRYQQLGYQATTWRLLETRTRIRDIFIDIEGDQK